MKKPGQLVMIVLMMSLISFTACSGNKDKNSLSRHKLNGRVKTVIETTYIPGKTNDELQKKGMQIDQYNEKGNETESCMYGADGRLQMKFTFTYDEKGNLIRNLTYDSTGRMIFTYLLRYNKKGNLTEDCEIGANGMLTGNRSTHEYDKQGNKTVTKVYDSHYGLRGIYTFRYDEKGNQAEQNIFTPEGVLKMRFTYKHDEKGNLTEQNLYDQDGVLRVSGKYTYEEFDKNGNWLREIDFSDNRPGKVISRKIEYY